MAHPVTQGQRCLAKIYCDTYRNEESNDEVTFEKYLTSEIDFCDDEQERVILEGYANWPVARKAFIQLCKETFNNTMQNKFQNALIWDKDDNIIAKCPATDDYIALALWVVPGAEYATTFNGDHYTYHSKDNLKEKINELENASSHGEGERISEMSAEISIYEDCEF